MVLIIHAHINIKSLDKNNRLWLHAEDGRQIFLALHHQMVGADPQPTAPLLL